MFIITTIFIKIERIEIINFTKARLRDPSNGKKYVE